MKLSGRVAVIGVGTMGETILRGIRQRKLIPASRLAGTVRTAGRARELSTSLGVSIETDNEEVVRRADIVVICLKPQNVIRMMQTLDRAGAFARRPLLISIAAGVTSSEMEGVLSTPCPVIRAMPNTPCAIGKGTTVIAAGRHARPSHLRAAHTVFDPLGLTLEIEEEHMNTATGLSGSGPAFGYLMIESLADGGVMMGLPRSVATVLAARTLLGAAEMVLASDRHPADLKDDVTTPAGCTIAGVLALEDGRIRSTLARAVERASQLAAQLGQRPTNERRPS